MRQRAATSRDAHLATADAEGRPHLVPIGFVIEGETVYFAVDSKPKQTVKLKRLRNIAVNPAVAVLFDEYDEDWSRLWWVRIDGTAHLVGDHELAEHAVDLLTEKYPQYGSHRPAGPVVAISIDRITGWSAGDNPGG